ncbi:MAG TPA: LysR family transcriptional regulator [Caulobacteraceae bacterium]|jgi:DNA-binding transcriptional LysR family regulator
MSMPRLEDLEAFIAIADKGSLTAAARHLGRSLPSVSRSLAALENDLGVELIARTTRRSVATEAGLVFYRRVGAALSEIEAAKREALNRHSEPSGLLRITSSTGLGPLHIVPAVSAFLELHPKVDVELDLSDGYVDLIDRGFDLAIRTGELPDSSLKAKRVANFRRVVFAAPSYLARRGRPETPDDLATHECIVRTAAQEGDAWSFLVDGRPTVVKVAGRFRASGSPATIEAAVEGLGIANAPLWQVLSLVDRGAIELVLEAFEPPRLPMHAVWPATRLLPAKTQLFIEFFAARMKKERF